MKSQKRRPNVTRLSVVPSSADLLPLPVAFTVSLTLSGIISQAMADIEEEIYARTRAPTDDFQLEDEEEKPYTRQAPAEIKFGNALWKICPSTEFPPGGSMARCRARMPRRC